MIFQIFTLAFSLLQAQNITINEPDTDLILNLPAKSSEIVLDGFPDEAAWQEIDPLPLTMYQPVHRGEMTQKTEIKVAYDNEFMYIAGKLYDNEPDKMIINSMYRDRYSGDETFAIIIDSFNDNENARWFFVTPSSARVDMQVSNDSEGNNSMNRDWNTYWDVATQVTNEGWFVEMRIPFSSLGFRKIDGEVNMGMIVYRYIARSAERHIFPDIPPVYSRGFTKPSQAQKVRMQNIDNKKPLYITPYALGGYEQYNELNSTGSRYQNHDDYVKEIGLDVKYPVSGNMNLDVTINTDFAQVEADDARINLSRFPLFIPEKRQFFQERSDIFDFSLGGNNTLFYSRRIGLNQGLPVRILGGARLAGRTGKWDVGVLNMQTDKMSSIDLLSENFGVYRARRNIINSNSYAGGIVTSRINAAGEYNISTGVDFLYNLTGNEFIDFKYAATLNNRPESNFDSFSNSIVRLNLHRRSVDGFYYNVTAKRAGAQYQPDLGFESRRDFTLIDVRLNYGFFNPPGSPFRIITPEIRHFISFRNADGSIQSRRLQHEWEIDFKNGSAFEAEASWWYEDLREPLAFNNNTFVPAGSYSFYGISLGYGMNNSTALRSDIAAEFNKFYDGTQVSFEVSPTWNISRHVEISGQADFNILTFPERNQKAYVNIYRLRSLLALNNQVSLQLLSQYNHLAGKIGTNARFRYNFREGNDLWIVFNETTNYDLNRFTPSLPRYDNRAVMVKYTYTFY
ncbi:MAG: DUF5916 domain-containing protein [Balneolaceae bacterium]